MCHLYNRNAKDIQPLRSGDIVRVQPNRPHYQNWQKSINLSVNDRMWL